MLTGSKTVPVEQPQPAVPPGLGGSEGGGLGAPLVMRIL